jgi:hypothetical protein
MTSALNQNAYAPFLRRTVQPAQAYVVLLGTGQITADRRPRPAAGHEVVWLGPVFWSTLRRLSLDPVDI